jgi:two-component system response regulator DesR
VRRRRVPGGEPAHRRRRTRADADPHPDALRLAIAQPDGFAVADIARLLVLSDGTVRNYLSSAMGKTGARTRAEAVLIAEERGWL